MGEWKKVFIGPKEFHDDILKLAILIPKGKYKYVTGIERGGLIIAVYLSHLLDLEYVTSPDLIEFIEDELSTVLVVDDLADTGKTLKSYYDVDTAVLYYKPRSVFQPTYIMKEVNNDDWIVFPFEKPDEIPNREV